MNQDIKFHWFDNLDESMILLKQNISEDLALKLKEKYEYNRNIYKLLGNHKPYYQLKKCKPIRLKTLKKILDGLNLDYFDYSIYIQGIGGSKFVFNTKFPVNLDVKESAILIAAFMSDGHNNSTHPHYANVGFLGDKIIKSATQLVDNIPYEFRNEHVRFHPILGKILFKLGVPYGCKSKINPPVPSFIYKNKDYKKEYLTQVFDDEGHAPTKISRKIILGRSVALKNLSKEFVSTLIYREKVYFNSLYEYAKKLVNNQPPNLLKGEYELLKEFGVKSSMRCRGITKYLDRVSADWVIEISGKENISKFNKEIGFSHPDKIKQINSYLGN